MTKPFKQTYGMNEKEYDRKYGKKIHGKPTPTKSSNTKRKLTPLGITAVVFFSLVGLMAFGLIALASVGGLIIANSPTGVSATQNEQPSNSSATQVTSTETQQAGVNNSSSSPKSNSTANQIQTSECKYTYTPHGTVYEDGSWLTRGETRTYPGTDGREYSCSYDKGKTWQVITHSDPTSTKVVVGTRTPTTPVDSRIPYQTAANNCAAAGATSNTSAFIPCMAAYGW